MKPVKWFVLAAFALIAQASLAGSIINTFGSPDGIAISGYDTVAFFTEKKAVDGKADYTYEWQGAKWQFAIGEPS